MFTIRFIAGRKILAVERSLSMKKTELCLNRPSNIQTSSKVRFVTILVEIDNNARSLAKQSFHISFLVSSAYQNRSLREELVACYTGRAKAYKTVSSSVNPFEKAGRKVSNDMSVIIAEVGLLTSFVNATSYLA